MAQASTIDWPAVLASAAARGLGVCELARELGHKSGGSVSKHNARAGYPLPKKRGKRGYKRPYAPIFACPAEWGLTAQQAQLVSVLVDAEGFVPVADLVATIAGDYREGADDRRLINVVVCHARRKLRPFGIHIEREWGRAVGLSDDAKRSLRAGAIRLQWRTAPVRAA